MHRYVFRQLAALTLAVGCSSLVGGCATTGGNVVGSWKIDMGMAVNRERRITAEGILHKLPDGSHIWRIKGANLNVCDVGAENAAVSRVDGQSVIEINPSVAGCPRVRWVINDDGTGFSQVNVDGIWKRGMRKVIGPL